MIIFFFFFYDNDTHQQVDTETWRQYIGSRLFDIERHYQWSRLSLPYKLDKIQLETVPLSVFYEICLTALIDPASSLTVQPEKDLYALPLPDTWEEFNALTKSLVSVSFLRMGSQDVGKRLRDCRRRVGMTADEVVTEWTELNKENSIYRTVTQATISNHERGAIGKIKLFDVIHYLAVYQRHIPVSLDDIALGCSFHELLDEAKTPKKNIDNDEVHSAGESINEYDDSISPYVHVHKPQIKDHEAAETILKQLDSTAYQSMRRLITLATGGKCEYCGQLSKEMDSDSIPLLYLNAVDPQASFSYENIYGLCPSCYAWYWAAGKQGQIADWAQRLRLTRKFKDLYERFQQKEE